MTNHSVMGVAQCPLSKTNAPIPATTSDKVIITIFVFIFVPPLEFMADLGSLQLITLASKFIRANHMPMLKREQRLMDSSLN